MKERTEIEIPNFVMDQTNGIIRSSRQKKVEQGERQKNYASNEEIRRATLQKPKKKQVLSTKRKRWIIIITLAATSVVLGVRHYRKATKVDPARVASDIQKTLDASLSKESALTAEYQNKNQALEEQIDDLLDAYNSSVRALNQDTQEEIDASLSEMGDRMLRSIFNYGSREVSKCAVVNPENPGYFYYDFSRFDMERFLKGWLENYTSSDVFEEVYQNLSSEEKNALALYASYSSVQRFDGGEDTKGIFACHFSSQKGQSDEEKLANAENISHEAAFRIAKTIVSDDLGVDLFEEKGRGR